MQICLRCKFCQHITISDKEEDMCLEIDAYEGEMRFVCRSCKKENKIKISKNNLYQQPLPQIKTCNF